MFTYLHVLQDSDPELTADSKDFKIAVARTRQAVSVQKAIGFMDASSPAKYEMLYEQCFPGIQLLTILKAQAC